MYVITIVVVAEDNLFVLIYAACYLLECAENTYKSWRATVRVAGRMVWLQ